MEKGIKKDWIPNPQGGKPRSKNMLIRNCCSPATGNEVPNQYVCNIGDTEIFQSYETVVAIRRPGKPDTVAVGWPFFQTTSRYLYQFLGITGGKKELEARIKNGSTIERELSDDIADYLPGGLK